MKFSHTEHSQSSFVKLKDGESIVGVLRGDPHEFRQHWSDQKSYVCAGKHVCSLCMDGVDSTFRFRINLAERTETGWVPKVLDQGYRVYEILKGLHEAGYKLERHLIKITREGNMQNTKYLVLPLPNGELTEPQLSQLEQLPLQDLTRGLVSQEDPHSFLAQTKMNHAAESDIPF